LFVAIDKSAKLPFNYLYTNNTDRSGSPLFRLLIDQVLYL